ncbi:MAG TPA: hypothetical protein PKD53_07745 [Chloroflexaceae bacterium]|nr:hypothetical protein [Chloroflexaceae bacterium]
MSVASAPLTELEAHYPEVITAMGATFASHEFVLALARRFERVYVAALAEHASCERPFQAVNDMLAERLANFPSLVAKTGERTVTDFFGNLQRASVWRKLC